MPPGVPYAVALAPPRPQSRPTPPPAAVLLLPLSSIPPLPPPQYVPAMTDPILGDYARNNPDARYAEASCRGMESY